MWLNRNLAGLALSTDECINLLSYGSSTSKCRRQLHHSIATASRILPLAVKSLAHLHVNSVSDLKRVPVSPENIPTARTVLEYGTRPTPDSVLSGPGLGLATMLHRMPFQCSISVCPVCSMPYLDPGLLLEDPPTAQMLLGEMAVTPLKRLSVDPGLGLATILHRMPFQCSISVRVTET